MLVEFLRDRLKDVEARYARPTRSKLSQMIRELEKLGLNRQDADDILFAANDNLEEAKGLVQRIRSEVKGE